MKATIMPVFVARPFTFGAVDGETYYYVTDGNKNVTALLDADGVRVAKYTYNPFGRILNSEGALAEINPFRFSSEYHDDETGLVYYNYRYYSPELGRWIKRDPIEEEGGVNLYAMVWNDSINLIDYNGLADNRRNIIKITVRAFYPGDSKVPQTRPDGSGDISAFGGFWVDATPKKCCCPEGGSKKDVVLMQLLKDGDNWRVDAYREDLQEGRLTNRNGVNRHQAYRDDEYDIHGKKTHSGGRGMNGSSVGYSDAPGLSRHPMTGEYELAGSYFREFRVEAFCRCAASDVYTGNSVDFSVTRPAKSPTILFAIRDVNCNGDPAANPSRYPARR